MAGEEQTLKTLNNFTFTKIFQTFGMSIHHSNIIIAFLAVVVICLAGWLMDFSKSVLVIPETQGKATELQLYITYPDQLPSYLENYKQTGQRKGVFETLWEFAAKRFQGAVNSLFALDIPGVAKNIADYFRAMAWALRYHYVYSAIFFIIKFVVIALAGGAICRITALQLAHGEKPGLIEPLRFAKKNFFSFLFAPLLPVIGIILCGLCIALLGLVGRIPWGIGDVIIAILMCLTFISGAIIAVLLIGTVAGFNLMFPAVAYDGSDFFDAMARAFGYIKRKPWHMLFYTATAAAYGAICYTFVRFFFFLLLWSSRWFLRFGLGETEGTGKLAAIWPKPVFTNLAGTADIATASWSETLAHFCVHLLILAVVGLLVAFVISFFFSANTIIYSLMRNKVDNTPLDDIYTLVDEPQSDLTDTKPEKPVKRKKQKTDSSD